MTPEQTHRIQRIQDMLDQTQAGEPDILADLTEDPAQFLVVEYDTEQYALFAVSVDTLEEAATFIDDSETHRDSVTVYNLDTDDEWNPNFRTVSFTRAGTPSALYTVS
jgi:hypothetical protein